MPDLESDRKLIELLDQMERAGFLSSMYYRLLPQKVEAECRLRAAAKTATT